MITLRFELNSGASTESIKTVGLDNADKVNNVSYKPTNSTFSESQIPDGSFQDKELLMVNSLYINQDGLLANSANGVAGSLESESNPKAFIFGLTDSNGEYELTLTLTADSGDTIDQIDIEGDAIAGQYPIEAIIDGSETIYSDDNHWSIKFASAESSHTIKFTKWNRPNYNAIITLLQVMAQYLDVDSTGIDELSSLTQLIPDPSEIHYGILSNSGNVKILDNNGELLDLIKDNILPNTNIPVKIFYNGTEVQNHITNDSSYLDGELTFSMDNVLNYIKNDSYSIPDSQKGKLIGTTASNLLTDILSHSNNKLSFVQSYTFIPYNNSALPIFAGSQLLDYMDLIVFGPIDYADLDEKVLDDVEKVLDACQLNMVLDDAVDAETGKNILRLDYARPIIPSNLANAYYNQDSDFLQMPKWLPTSYIMEDSGTSYIRKNKFKEVDIDVLNYNTTQYVIENMDTNTISRFNDSGTSMSDVETYLKEHSIFESDEITVDNFASYFDKDMYLYVTKNNNNVLQYWFIVTKTIEFADEYKNIKYNSTSSGKTFFTLASSSPEGSSDLFSREYYVDDNYGSTNTNSIVINDIDNFVTYIDSVKNSSGAINASFYACGAFNDFMCVVDNNNSNKYKIILAFKTTNNFDGADQLDEDTLYWNYDEDEEKYVDWAIRYSALQFPIKFWITSSALSSEGANGVTINTTTKEYETKNIRAQGYEDANISDNEIFTIGQNPLVTNQSYVTTPYNTAFPLYKYIANNILQDYSDGIMTKTIKVAIKDLHYYANTDVRAITNTILKLGEVIRITDDKYADGNVILWRITGRELIEDGESLLKLELQEVKPADSFIDINDYAFQSGLYDSNYNQLYTWQELKNNGYVTVTNGLLSSVTNDININGSLFVDSEVTSLKKDVFKNKSNIKYIGLPDTLESIGESAFEECSNITTIEIPKGVANIEKNAFAKCSSLVNIVVDVDNANYASDGSGLLYNKDKTTLICVPYAIASGSFVIPQNVTSIGDYAFSKCNELTSITIPNTVTSIGNAAFYVCSKLTSVVIPDSVTTLGSAAFNSCNKLESVVLSTNITEIPNQCFEACKLSSFYIHRYITKIGIEALGINSNLSNIEFEDTEHSWKICENSDGSGTVYQQAYTPTNTETNATYLKNTYMYRYWFKNS